MKARETFPSLGSVAERAELCRIPVSPVRRADTFRAGTSFATGFAGVALTGGFWSGLSRKLIV